MIPAILFSIGITHVWARGTIFARARALWPALLDCPLCAGVWISLLVQVGLTYQPIPTAMLGIACTSASASLAVYGLIRAIPTQADRIENRRHYHNHRVRWDEPFKEGNGYLP